MALHLLIHPEDTLPLAEVQSWQQVKIYRLSEPPYEPFLDHYTLWYNQDKMELVVITPETEMKMAAYLEEATMLTHLSIVDDQAIQADNITNVEYWSLHTFSPMRLFSSLAQLSYFYTTFKGDFIALSEQLPSSIIQLTAHLTLPFAVAEEDWLAACDRWVHFTQLTYVKLLFDDTFSIEQIETFITYLSKNSSLEIVILTGSQTLPPTPSYFSISGKGALHLLSLYKLPIRHMASSWQYDTLKILNLNETAIEDFPALLPQIEELSVVDCPHLNLSSILAQMQPDLLRRLIIRQQQLTTLPATLGKFTQLEVLDLERSPIATLPANIYKLRQLNLFSISKDSPISQRTELSYGSPLITLLRNMEKQQLSAKKCHIQMALFVQDTVAITTYSIAELLEGILPAAHKGVERGLLTYLEKTLADPFTQPTFQPEAAHLSLWGKFNSLYIRPTKALLAKKKIKFTTKITAQTTHICLGENFHKASAQDITTTNLPVATPSQLKSLLERIETPYLKKEDNSLLNNNLEALLNSDDASNVAVALTMMKEGGIPSSMLYKVVIIWWRGVVGQKNSALLRTLIQKAVSSGLYMQLSTLKRRWNKEKALQDLLKSPEVETALLAKTILQIDNIHSEQLLKKCVEILLKENKETANWVIALFTKAAVCYWQRWSLRHLLDSEADLHLIKQLQLRFAQVKNKTQLKRLGRLSQLTTLFITDIPREATLTAVQSLLSELYPQWQVLEAP
ncbi:MAG: leucine-rich repeat domain-containing protein [Thermonemataceae bacterium]